MKKLIGPAGRHQEVLERKVWRIKQAGSRKNLKALFYGPPGTGKTALAEIVARELAGHHLAIEHINGQSMSVDLVRTWSRSFGMIPMFGDRTVKIVDEIDRASEAAQCEWLTFIDRMPPEVDFIATTNQPIASLPERLHTRLQLFKFDSPTVAELAEYLIASSPVQLTKAIAVEIANGNNCNVRGALLDLETHLDSML